MSVSPRYLALEDRLARAEQHLGDLDTEFRVWLQAHPVEVRREFKADGWVTHFHKFTENPPHALALIVGDFAHNVRAVLDNLVYELVSANPKARVRDTHCFPIETNERDFLRKVEARRSSDGRGVLDGISPSGVAIIQGLQPYNRGDAPSVTQHMRIVLGQLRDLNNFDKHRTIMATGAYLTPEKPRFDAVPPGTADVVSFERPTKLVALEPDTDVEVISYRKVITDPKNHVDVHVTLPVAIIVGQNKLKLGMTDLRNMVVVVGGIVSYLWAKEGHAIPPGREGPTSSRTGLPGEG